MQAFRRSKGVLEIAESDQDGRKTGRIEKPRFQRERALEALGRIPQRAARRQGQTEVVVGLRIIRLQREGVAIVSDRLIKAAKIRQHIGDVEMRFGGRSYCDGPLKGGERLVAVPLCLQRVPEIEMRLRVVGIERDGAAIMRRGLLEPAESAVGEAGVLEKLRR